MKERLIFLNVAAALTFAFLLNAVPLQASQECTEKLEKNCTSCHYKNRICNKIGEKNKRSWKNTTKRMIRYGLKLSKSEISEIVDCLVSLENSPDKFCN